MLILCREEPYLILMLEVIVTVVDQGVLHFIHDLVDVFHRMWILILVNWGDVYLCCEIFMS